MIVRELITKLGFKANDAPLKRIDKGLNSLKRTAIAAAAAVTAVGGGILALTKSTATLGDLLAKTSARVGISVENLQKLQFSAELAGANFETVNKAIVRFSKTIADAQDGMAESKEAFDDLQLDATQFNTTEEAIFAVADRFKDMQDGYKKTQIASDLFGARSGTKLINLLNQGSEAIKAQGIELESLGAIMSDKTAKDSEVFNDTMLRINKVLLGFKITVGKELIPVLSAYLQKVLDWVKLNKDLIKTKIAEFMRVFIRIMRKVFDVLRGGLKRIKDFVDELGGVEEAIDLLVKGFKIFIGLKIVFALGNIATGFITLAAAMKLAGGAAIFAQGAIVAIPAAVLALFALIGFQLDDLNSFFKGEKSLIGKFNEWLWGDNAEAAKDNARKILGGDLKTFLTTLVTQPMKFVTDSLKVVNDAAFALYKRMLSRMWAEAKKSKFAATLRAKIETVKAKWNELKNFFTNTIDKIKLKISNLATEIETNLINAIDKLKSKLLNFVIKGGIKLFGGGDGDGDQAKNGGGNGNSMVAGLNNVPNTLARAGASVGGTQVAQSNSINMKNEISVNVSGTNASPDEIGGQVAQMIEKTFDRKIRSTMRSLQVV